MSSDLPHELIQAIVDELSDDTASLKACSLVAIAFCSPSQRHIFKSMWLHRENWHFYTVTQQHLHLGSSVPSGTIQGGDRLFQKSPHVAAYIRDLRVDLPESTTEDLPLERVLQMLPNLERLMISGFWLSWSDLSIGLMDTILGVLAQPALDRLHILSIRHLPGAVVLRALSSVRVFSLYGTQPMDEDSEEKLDEPDFSLSAACEHLILGSSGPDLPYICALMLQPNTPILARITQMSLRVDWEWHQYTLRLLAATSATLEHLELDCGGLEIPITLPHLPQLRTLALRITLGISRTLPLGLEGTLGPLPRVALAMEFLVKDRLQEGSWSVPSGPLHLPDGWEMHSLRGELVFFRSSIAAKEENGRDAVFGAFCLGVKTALPGKNIEFAKGEDVLHPYVGRLP